MPRVGFEPTISAGERPKTYALDRVPTGTGIDTVTGILFQEWAQISVCYGVQTVFSFHHC